MPDRNVRFGVNIDSNARQILLEAVKATEELRAAEAKLAVELRRVTNASQLNTKALNSQAITAASVTTASKSATNALLGMAVAQGTVANAGQLGIGAYTQTATSLGSVETASKGTTSALLGVKAAEEKSARAGSLNVNAYTKTAGALNSVQTASKGTTNALLGVTVAEKKVAVATASTTAALKKQVAPVRSLELGWKSFFRLIALRLAAGVLFRVKNELVELSKASAEASKGIAEIQTIITRSEQTVAAQARISSAITRVAIDNNIELTDSINAFYANLSNQVSNNLAGLESFTQTAIRLSKATVSSLEYSGNAISSVIQAYSLSILEAERVSAILFKSVDEGRFKLSEIANTLGRVGLPAHALGITFEETSAALDRLTLQGVKANQGQTLLLNVYQKLLRPTGALKDIHAEWGIETGKQAIEAFGFTGVLRKLNEESKKGANILPDLFGRIRAGIGAQGLAGSIDSVDKFIDTLDAVSNAGDQFATAVNLVEDSAGERFQNELNKARVSLINTFGGGTVKLVNSLNESIKQMSLNTVSLADVAIATGKVLATTLALTAAVKLLRLAYVNTFAIARALQVLAGPWGLVAVAVGTAALALFDYNVKQEAILESNRQLLESNKKAFDEQQLKRILVLRERLAQSGQKQAKFAANIRIALNANLDAVQDELELALELEGLNTNRTDSIKSVNTAYTKTISSLEGQVKLEEQLIKAAQDRNSEILKNAESAKFTRSIRNLGDGGQINAQLNRSRDLAFRAVDAVRSGDFDEGRKFVDEALQLLTVADQSSFDLTGESNFEQRFQNINQLALDLEKSAERTARRARNSALRDMETFEARIQSNEKLVEDILESKRLIEEVSERTLELASNTNIEEDRRNSLAETNFSIAKTILGTESLILRNLIDQYNITLRTAKLNQSETIRRNRAESIGTLNRKIGEGQSAQNTIISTTFGEVQESIPRAIADLSNRLRGSSSVTTAAAREISAELITSIKVLEDFKKAGFDGTLSIQELGRGLQLLGKSEEGSLALTRFTENQQKLVELQTQLTPLILAQNESEGALNKTLEDQAQTAAELATISEESKEDARLQKQLEEARRLVLDSQVQSLRDRGVEEQKALDSAPDRVEAVDTMAESERVLAEQVDKVTTNLFDEEGNILLVTNTIINSEEARQQYIETEYGIGAAIAFTNEQLKERARLGNGSIGSVPDTQFRAAGGPIFRSRGSDTVPAMLTPGEYVINARSAQANRGLLSQINNSAARVRPQYLAEGGAVTQTFNNDINLNSTGNESVDVRRIQRELNRGQRRKTSGPRVRSFS